MPLLKWIAPRALWQMKAVRLAVLLMLPVLLGACSSTIVATAEPFCADVVRPVCVSREDKISEPTARQIEGNNLGIVHMCKIRPKDVCPKGAVPAAQSRGLARKVTS